MRPATPPGPRTRADVQGHPARFTIGALTPIMLVVLVAYLIIGLAMPVLPLYVHQELGLSTFLVGVAAGVEFAAALLSRFWAGTYADTRGAKRAMSLPELRGSSSWRSARWLDTARHVRMVRSASGVMRQTLVPVASLTMIGLPISMPSSSNSLT